jgi:hypothetical protein
MAYTIYKSDGSAISIPDNTVDAQFYSPNANGASKGIGTQLIGRNAVDHGQPIAQNFLQLTENFCGTVAPPDLTAMQGQLWFDKTAGVLKVNVSGTSTAAWRSISTIADTGASTGYDGQIKVVGHTVYIWANSAWRQVYPAAYS